MVYDVLSLGPARMDVFVTLPEDEVVEVCSVDRKRCMIEMGFGEKIAVSGMEFSIGGNAGNNAVGLARLGLNTAMVGAVGDGWTDEEVMKILQKEGIETKYIQKISGQKGFGVIINYQGERTILSYYSHSLCCWPDDRSLRAKWVYLTSMGEGYEDFYRSAVDFAAVTGAKIAFNPGTRQIKAGMEKLKYAYEKTEVLFVNREEAGLLLGKDAGTEVEELLTGLEKIGPKVVIITDGPGGTYARYEGRNYYMPIVPATVVERTGAGDAFGSGFLGAYIRGESVDTALKWGTVNSASVLEYIGPQKGLLDIPGMKTRVEANEHILVKEV